jgi:hypothetical protein
LEERGLDSPRADIDDVARVTPIGNAAHSGRLAAR